jgi:hypothetical protein
MITARKTRISKREFYLNGGFSHPNQYRKATTHGWTYWRWSYA